MNEILNANGKRIRNINYFKNIFSQKQIDFLTDKNNILSKKKRSKMIVQMLLDNFLSRLMDIDTLYNIFHKDTKLNNFIKKEYKLGIINTIDMIIKKSIKLEIGQENYPRLCDTAIKITSDRIGCGNSKLRYDLKYRTHFNAYNYVIKLFSENSEYIKLFVRQKKIIEDINYGVDKIKYRIKQIFKSNGFESMIGIFYEKCELL